MGKPTLSPVPRQKQIRSPEAVEKFLEENVLTRPASVPEPEPRRRGRPKNPVPLRQISIYLPPEQILKLKHLAVESDTSNSQVISDALDKYLNA